MTPLQRSRQKLFPDWQSLSDTVQRWKSQGMRIVFTNGCFDILHPGHIDYLSKAAGLGDKLIIGLNADVSVSRLKGKHRPIQDAAARATILSALEFIDAVTVFEQDNPAELISFLSPDILVKGADYTIDQIAGARSVMEKGGSVVLLPYLKGFSTSAIEKRIRQAGG